MIRHIAAASTVTSRRSASAAICCTTGPSTGGGSGLRCAGGGIIQDYQITDMGSELTLRTFCHENGHMVCDFPDLYDKEGRRRRRRRLLPDGLWRIGKEPDQVSGYLKHAAGWSTRERNVQPGDRDVAAGSERLPGPPQELSRVLPPGEPPRQGRDAYMPTRACHLARGRARQQRRRADERRRPLRTVTRTGRRALRPRTDANYGDLDDAFGHVSRSATSPLPTATGGTAPDRGSTSPRSPSTQPTGASP